MTDHEIQNWNTKQFEVIEETDEEFYFDILENSESDNFDDDDAMKGLKHEVSKHINV